MILNSGIMTFQGPLSVFSARQKISAPRPYNITHDDGGLGFTLHGDGPVKVENVERRLRVSVEIRCCESTTHLLGNLA